VKVEELLVDVVAGFHQGTGVLDLRHAGLAVRHALVQAAPVDGGQRGADDGLVAVFAVGFHPGDVVVDGIVLIHQLDHIVGLAVLFEELPPLGQGTNESVSHGVNLLYYWGFDGPMPSAP
jgi:hypothetical protein